MKCLLLLLFLPIFAKSQQQIEVCEDSQTIFLYSTISDQISTFNWYVDGDLQTSDSSSILIDWVGFTIGSHLLSVDALSNNCKSVTIQYGIKLIDCQKSYLYAPNAFSPNGDGLNDIWSPVGLNVIDVDYRIFNRWGDQIFTSNDIKIGWEGKFKGENCLIDLYVYVLTWVVFSGESKKEIGHISLVR